MATDVPEAQNLKSWEQAFQYPIPTVRRVEQELRRDIASNKDKLRSLVGVRYRDLLNTAQTIVEMNGQIQNVETNLADIGMRCNPRLMEKKSSHLHELRNQRMGEGADERSRAAQLTLLNNCISAISRILRTHGSCVLAAKLNVISRQLYKSLTQNNKSVPDFLKNLGDQSDSLRSKLLRRTDRRMVSVRSTTADIIESMSAFCLATSSSFQDAIRHFHHIRSKAIEFCLTEAQSAHSSIVEAFNIYIRTLRETAQLVSGRLSDALGRLTPRPIMSDPAIQGMGELSIDILQEFVSDDIKHFIPWIKHDNVSKPEADRVMRKWSKESFSNFCAQAGNLLEGAEDFSDLIDLRRSLLEAWLPIQYSTPTHSSLEVLQGLRDLINNQLISVLRAQSEGLSSLGHDLASTISNWSDIEAENSVLSLWEPDVAFLDFSEGAGTFKEEITNRMLGESPAVLRMLDSYQIWLSATQGRQSMIAELRRTKWNHIAEDDEDDEEEDVDGMLNDDDPHQLQSEHEKSLVKGFTILHTSLSDALSNLDGEHRSAQAAFMMRVIREIRRKIPAEYAKEDRGVFAEDLIPNLRYILASETISQVRPMILTRGLKSRQSKCPGRSLWEGDPQLPAQPSPMTFKFLRELTAAMEQQGQDLWNPEVVDEMKHQLVERVVSHVRRFLNEMPVPANVKSIQNHHEGQESMGDENYDNSPATETPTAQETDSLHDRKIQLLFDMLYLSHALSHRSSSIQPVIDILVGEHGLSDAEILTTRAQEYWKRTQVLFGLLA